MGNSKVIYLGIKGTVIALDAATGTQIWATHLTGSDFVNIVLDGDNLYASTRGEIYCLNPINGGPRWRNELKGFGYGLCSITSETGIQQNLLSLIREVQSREEAAQHTAPAGGAH